MRASFWMVWRDSGSAPTKRHATRDDAYGEAHRLAERNPGVVFYVMEAIASYRGDVHVEVDRLVTEAKP